jgi:hypothetical protein
MQGNLATWHYSVHGPNHESYQIQFVPFDLSKEIKQQIWKETGDCNAEMNLLVSSESIADDVVVRTLVQKTTKENYYMK